MITKQTFEGAERSNLTLAKSKTVLVGGEYEGEGESNMQAKAEGDGDSILFFPAVILMGERIIKFTALVRRRHGGHNFLSCNNILAKCPLQRKKINYKIIMKNKNINNLCMYPFYKLEALNIP